MSAKKAKAKTEKVETQIDVEQLKEISAFCKSEMIVRELTDDQRVEIEHDVAGLGIKNQEHEDEKAEFMEEWKNKNKPVKTAIGTHVRTLRDGEISTIEIVFGIRSVDNGSMHLYDELGIFIETREIRLEEMQGALGEEPQGEAKVVPIEGAAVEADADAAK